MTQPENHSLLYYIQKSTEFLTKKGIPSPRLEAELLISHILKFSRIQLYTKFDMELGEKQREEYRSLIKKRAEFTPTAYLLATKNFFGYDFTVDERVLIPRPETEELVDYALKNLPSQEKFSSPESSDEIGKEHIKVLDLCCGSGCIGISFALENKSSKTQIHFVDVSNDALDITRINASKLFTKHNRDEILEESKFIESDLLSSLPEEEKYDLILSNPPYVLKEEESSLSPEVLKEPRLALVVEDFDAFHMRLLMQAKAHLIETGYLWMETNPLKMDDLVKIAENLGWKTEVVKDLSGKERFLKGYL
ncbi:MAG: peptide chain release factor N(5)-glutamine methyltransferase [Leptospira sp.]|nr:peptide chain release factor N(5)-glutamine methyltransferase [Leptospira sp.]